MGSWLSDVGNAGTLFLESIPDAISLAYAWAKDWQGLLAGMLLFGAAWKISRSTLRAARIRATAMVRSAEIAARASHQADPHAVVAAMVQPSMSKAPPQSPENELVRKVEHMRSLIRSAMATLTSDSGGAGLGPNFYCEKIVQLKFDDADLPQSSTAEVRNLHRKLVLQLALVRQAMEKKVPNSELSQVLVRLNGRARDLSSSLGPLENAQAAAAPT